MRQQINGGNVFFYSKRNKGKLKVYTRKVVECFLKDETKKNKTSAQRRPGLNRKRDSHSSFIKKVCFCFLKGSNPKISIVSNVFQLGLNSTQTQI